MIHCEISPDDLQPAYYWRVSVLSHNNTKHHSLCTTMNKLKRLKVMYR